MLFSSLHPSDEECHMCWLTFNASLSQTVLEMLLRDDFTLKAASLFFMENLCRGKHWPLFPTGQVKLHEDNWPLSMIIHLSSLAGKIYLTSEQWIPSLRINIHSWDLQKQPRSITGEQGALGFLCCPYPVNSLYCGWAFHCTWFSPCARKHPVFLIILSSSSHSTPCLPVHNHTAVPRSFSVNCSHQEMECISCLPMKVTQWEKGLVCARDGSVQPVMTILHCSEDISQPEEQYSKAAGPLLGKWVWNNFIAGSTTSLFSSQAQECRCKLQAANGAVWEHLYKLQFRTSFPKCTFQTLLL